MGRSVARSLSFLAYRKLTSPSGWSLGGILSLEMAHQIAISGPRRLRRFRVVGMLWIDTVFPHHVEGEEGKTGNYAPGPNERIDVAPAELEAMSNKDLANLNMMHARRMVQSWDMPRWGLEGGEGGQHGDGAKRRSSPPPTILLRARDAGKNEDGSKKFVDRTRQLRMLGWEGYDAANGGFVKSVVDVEGEHFTLFDFDKVEGLSKHIRKAADDLEAQKW
ncbi:hypothetical protein MN608_09042 [Microdochium nivale]|nr:hypothetical protein MN608_09042 [Microdochium nivale]